MQKVVFYGGAFDPIHIGHLKIAQKVYQLIKPDLFYFVPLSNPVHKPKTMFSESSRVEFLKKALAGNPVFQIYYDEIERQGSSYTVETLQRFISKQPLDIDFELYYIIGSDEYYDLANWKEPEKILDLAKIVVVNRPGSQLPEDPQPQVGDKDRYLFVKNVSYDISSSRLRGYLQHKDWDALAEYLPFDINLLKEHDKL